MNIVIGGAGDVGFHLARLLVSEDQNIILIDNNEDVLEYASTHLDVSTVKGEITSIETLMNSDAQNADLFIAVTTYESSNLLACILAKKLGSKQTIARISNPEFFHKVQRKNFQEAGVDNLFSPRILATYEIRRLLQRVSATDIFEFEDGKISIIGFTADSESNLVGKSLKQFTSEATDNHLRVIVLLRNNKTIIPRMELIIEPGDHIYLSTDLKDFEKVNKYVGKTLKKIKKVMIVGDGALAKSTAKILEDDYNVTIVVSNKTHCKKCAEYLDDTLIIEGDGNNADLLIEAGLPSMDAFVALTPNSETNIISCLMAEKYKGLKTIALVDNSAYTHISQSIGVDTIINKKILAANNIFRFVRQGQIEAIASFHGVDAEIIEFTVHAKNSIIGKTISAIGLPADAIVAGVIRGEKGLIPTNDFQFKLDDKVIVFLMPTSVKAVEDIFK